MEGIWALVAPPPDRSPTLRGGSPGFPREWGGGTWKNVTSSVGDRIEISNFRQYRKKSITSMPRVFCADTDRKLPYTRYNISKPYRYCFLFYRSISNTINNATRYTDTDRKLQPTVRDNEIVSIRFLFNRYRIKLDYRSIPNGVWKGDILGGERF